MFRQSNFRPTIQAILFAFVMLVLPSIGYGAAAGRVDFAVGEVVASAADDSRRPLVKGSEILAGDTISTGKDGRAQIRFSDGGYVSLQPGTLFRVDDYHYDNKADGSEKGFFSLLKGGLRTITGVIGHFNRDNYKLSTPVATIGIRGTVYNATFEDALTVSVIQGSVLVSNNGGSLILEKGQSAFAADANTAPQLTGKKASAGAAGGGGGAEFTAGDCIENCGGGLTLTQIIENPPPDNPPPDNPPPGGSVTLTGVTAVFASSQLITPQVGSERGGDASFDAAGIETTYIQRSNGQEVARLDFTGATADTSVNNGIPASGFNGTIGWGRYYGTITSTESGGVRTASFGPNDGLHTVVGLPSATTPTSGSAHFNLTGATRPTIGDGSFAPGTVTDGGMDVHFGAVPTFTGQLHMIVGPSNQNLEMNFNGFTGLIAATTREWSGPNGTAPLTGTVCNPGGCAATKATAFFAGDNAAYAGMAYSINLNGTQATNQTLFGGAVYTNTGTPALR